MEPKLFILLAVFFTTSEAQLPGLTGLRCLGGRQTCPNNPCLGATCSAHPQATCTLDNCGGCFTKWYLNGNDVTDQCLDPDHCFRQPCQNGGICTNIPNDYTCTCPPGYTGKNCESVQETKCSYGRLFPGKRCDTRDLTSCPATFKCIAPVDAFSGHCCLENNMCEFGLPESLPDGEAKACQGPGSYSCDPSYACNFTTEPGKLVAVCCPNAQTGNPPGVSPVIQPIGTPVISLGNTHQSAKCENTLLKQHCGHLNLCQTPCNMLPTADCVIDSCGKCHERWYLHNIEISTVCGAGLQCQNGLAKTCLISPCTDATCPSVPGAICRDDPCGGCYARWFNNTEEVTEQCKVIDHCMTNPCQHNAVCTSNPTTYECTCAAGYKGKNCEIIDHCYNNPCLNNGTCAFNATTYSCTCKPGYGGWDCEIVDHCFKNPCLNGGNCSMNTTSYECACTHGYGGRNCEIISVANMCSNNTCLNGGNCTHNSTTYQCTCATGYTGDNCEMIDHCLTNPCLNGGNCVPTATSYECTCSIGYDGLNCENTNYCYNNPCLNGGQCTSGPTTYECTCAPRFQGRNCETTNYCYGVNCLNNGTCVEKPNGYFCKCTEDFTGTHCQIDISTPAYISCEYGRLTQGQSTVSCAPKFVKERCPPNFYCKEDGMYSQCCLSQQSNLCGQNTPLRYGQDARGCLGPYSSECPSSHKCVSDLGDGVSTCCPIIAPDSCLSSPCVNGGICKTLGNSFTCDCPSTYTGPRCESAIVQVPPTYPKCAYGKLMVNNQQVVCSPGTPTCPANYVCHGPMGQTGSCCRQMEHSLCGANGMPYQENGEAVYCDVQNPLSCPSNYACISNNDPTGVTAVCCPSQPPAYDKCLSNPCLNGGICKTFGSSYTCDCPPTHTGASCETVIVQVPPPLPKCAYGKLMVNNQQVMCSPGTPTCPANYVCHGPMGQMGSCCRQMEHNICGANGTPYQENGEAVYCDLQNPQSCPNNYACISVNDPAGVTAVCCPSQPPVQTPCLNNKVKHTCAADLCKVPPCTFDGSECVIDECGGCYKRWFHDWYEVTGHCIDQKPGICVNNEMYDNTCGRLCEVDPVTNTKPTCNGVKRAVCRADQCGGCYERWYLGQEEVTDKCANPDQCTPNPCQNNGSCISLKTTYQCKCEGIYEGANCAEPNFCKHMQCANGGNCTNTATAGVCTCPPGFVGDTCQSIDYCSKMNPCINGGTCVNRPTTHECLCPNPYTGPTCSEFIPIPAHMKCTYGHQSNGTHPMMCDPTVNSRVCGNHFSCGEHPNPTYQPSPCCLKKVENLCGADIPYQLNGDAQTCDKNPDCPVDHICKSSTDLDQQISVCCPMYKNAAGLKVNPPKRSNQRCRYGTLYQDLITSHSCKSNKFFCPKEFTCRGDSRSRTGVCCLRDTPCVRFRPYGKNSEAIHCKGIGATPCPPNYECQGVEGNHTACCHLTYRRKCSRSSKDNNCQVNLCKTEFCADYPEARCIMDNCGGCKTRWFYNGNEYTDKCRLSKGCPIDKPAKICKNNPCQTATCANYPNATCTYHKCGADACQAKFFENMKEVTNDCQSNAYPTP